MGADFAIYRRGFWLGRWDALAVARVRIALGCVILWDLVERLRDFHTFYTDHGIMTAVDPSAAARGMSSWSLLNLFPGTVGVGILWTIGILAFVGMTIGLYTRASMLVGWIILVSIQRRMPFINYGGDFVESIVLFWLLFVDCSAALSCDVRLGRRAPAATVAAFPVRLVQIQIAAIYFFTGLYKLNDVWLGGTAMLRVFHSLDVARPWSVWLASFPKICRIFSYAVPPSEIGLGILLLTPWRTTRMPALVGAYAMHLAIIGLLRVDLFSPAMMSVLLIFVARPPTFDAAAPAVRPGLAAQLAAALMVLVLAAQIAGVARRDRPVPTLLMAPAGLFGIQQKWPMFDRPYATDYQWHGRGSLVDDREVDLDAALPEIFGPTQASTVRWLKLRGSLTSPFERALLTRYVCRRYNSTAAVRMRSFELLLVEQDALAPAAPSPPRVIAKQDCVITNGGGAGAPR